jgi:hypothetical protein
MSYVVAEKGENVLQNKRLVFILNVFPFLSSSLFFNVFPANSVKFCIIVFPLHLASRASKLGSKDAHQKFNPQ